MKSFIDSNLWKRGIARALQIRGAKDAPNEVNIDQVQFVVDALQEGFAVYEHLDHIETNVALNGSSTVSYVLLEPSTTSLALDDPRNNNGWESRLLGLDVRLDNIGAASGEIIWVALRLQKSNNSATTFVRLEQPQIGGISEYRFHLPNLTNVKDLSQGGFENFSIPQQGWGWTGWIPANARLTLEMGRLGGAFGADDVASISMQWLRVPKGVKPPY